MNRPSTRSQATNGEDAARCPADESLLGDLLVQWEECRERGRPQSADELCGDRPELVDELQRRIDALAAIDSVLNGGASASNGPDDSEAANGRAAGDRQPPTAALGTAAEETALERNQAELELPGYAIESQLGRGGMGVVYRARQLGLDRAVAVKMIVSGETASREQRDRFRREAEAVARMQHPNIVQIYDIGDHGGRPYFSMELAGGGTLAEQLGGTPQPPEVAAELVETLARAVHVAHSQGILHRDLKPANVLLGAEGTLKVSDFGLAKHLDAELGPTRTGSVLGTPSYMSPEQARGQLDQLGPATDIYALGAILYESLTGRPPFRAATAVDTVMQVINDDPVPPRQLQSAVPRDLETICLKCLDKRPAHRFESAAALAEDLGRYRNGEPIKARPISVWGRGLKFARRRPLITTSLTIALLAVVATFTVGAAYNRWLGQVTEDLRETNQTLDAARRQNERLTSLSFAAYGRACSVAARIANMDDSLVVTPSRSAQVSNQAIGEFQLHRELLMSAGDPAVHAALDAYARELSGWDRSRINLRLRQRSRELAEACGAAWRKSIADQPEAGEAVRRHLYARARAAAGRLLAASRLAAASHAYDEFWELYWGELAIVESPAVTAAMRDLGVSLKQWKAMGNRTKPAQLHQQFVEQVAALHKACDESLGDGS